jgi:hypothetical protein
MLVWILYKESDKIYLFLELKERFMWFAMIQWWKTQLFQTILMMFGKIARAARDQDLPIFVQNNT